MQHFYTSDKNELSEEVLCSDSDKLLIPFTKIEFKNNKCNRNFDNKNEDFKNGKRENVKNYKKSYDMRKRVTKPSNPI